MKAHFHIPKEMQRDIEKRAYEAIMNERADIATRAMYLVLLAMYQVGLSPKTMRKVRDAIPVVTEKYHEYKADQLADEWAHVLLEDVGVETRETEEKL